MRLGYIFGTVVACMTAISGYTTDISHAVQLRDGTVYFVQPPRLRSVVTTYKETSIAGVTYYFTIEVPENAGEPLQRVTINQREVPDEIKFDEEDSFAFEGTRGDRGNKLALKDVTSERKTQTVTLTFEPPVSPGKTITIGLKPRENPDVPGVYLFGVTAFPVGEKPHGQFLGYGRLQFYRGGNDSSILPHRWFGSSGITKK
jgi:hypothetical protein